MKSAYARLLLVPLLAMSLVSTCCGPTTEPKPAPPAPPMPGPEGPFRPDCVAAFEHIKPMQCSWVTTPAGHGFLEWCTFYADRKKIDPVCMQRALTCDEADKC